MNRSLPLAGLVSLVVIGCSGSQEQSDADIALQTTYAGSVRVQTSDHKSVYVNDLGARVNVYDEDNDPRSMTPTEFCRYLISRNAQRSGYKPGEQGYIWLEKIKPSLEEGCKQRFVDLDANGDDRLDYHDDLNKDGRISNADVK